MLQAIGIRNGPVFMQGLINKDTIRFYDPGLRFAGGDYEQLFQAVTGLSLTKYLVEYALSGTSTHMDLDDDLVWLNGRRILQLCPALRPGTIGSIHGVDELLKNDHIVTYSPNHRTGDLILRTGDIHQRLAEIGIISSSLQEETEALIFIKKTLQVKDMSGEDMICTPFDIL